jgi:mannan endo-1,4-beta-mannosidase
MKPRSFILIGVLLSLFSCGKEELESCPETGNLHIEIGLFIRSDEVERHLKATSTGDFYVGIYTDEGLPTMTYEHASEMPEEIVLPVGEYYVEAHSNNDLPASFENPFYHGISDVFAITGNGLQAVGVNCELANTMVSIIYSDRIRTDFTNWSATVESSAGSLAFSGDETRPGYFRKLKH